MQKCETHCIYNHKRLETEFASKAYIAFNLNERDRFDSSSGGMFSALCRPILKRNGFVIGVKYDEKFTVTYDIADSEAGCQAFRYSKYVEPQHNDIYRKTRDALKRAVPSCLAAHRVKLPG